MCYHFPKCRRFVYSYFKNVKISICSSFPVVLMNKLIKYFCLFSNTHLERELQAKKKERKRKEKK